MNSSSPDVKRSIGPFTATSIVIANMIGAGIFTTSGIMANYLPSPVWVIGCWILGGIIALAGALSYAELSTRMPEEGGEYIYLTRLYHPALGFLTGWTSFIVGFSVPVAASAIAFASYLTSGTLGTARVLSIPLPVWNKVIAITIITAFTLLHYTGMKWGAFIQNALTALKIVLILGLATAGFLVKQGDWSHLFALQSAKPETMAFGTAMMLVMFAYSGWNASSYIAGEMKKPKKNLPLSLFMGTLSVMIIYTALNALIFISAPYQELKGDITIAETASIHLFGPWVGAIFGKLIAFALLSSLSAYIIIGPRVYYAMAKNRLFFKFASNVHPKFGVPSNSILIQGSLAVIMVLIGSFEQLLIYMGFALSIFPWLAVAGVFLSRRNRTGDSIAVKTPGYPITPLFYLIASSMLMIVAFINRPMESSIAVLTILLGIPCYFLIQRNN